MIHVEMLMPDGTDTFFLVEENAAVKKLLQEFAEFVPSAEPAGLRLFDELGNREIDRESALSDLGITSGWRLRLEMLKEEG